jgi:hypothetical protein
VERIVKYLALAPGRPGPTDPRRAVILGQVPFTAGVLLLALL